MKRLSNRQEQVMAILWEHGPMTVAKIVPFIDSNLHYNTISTVVRELDKLGYLSHNGEFRPYLYYPRISKDEYLEDLLSDIVKRFFNNKIDGYINFLLDS